MSNENLTENISKYSETEVAEVRNLAMKKKKHIRFRTYESHIDGDYKVRVEGMGDKSIKCVIYLDYKTILENKANNGLENMIYDKLLTIGESK